MYRKIIRFQPLNRIILRDDDTQSPKPIKNKRLLVMTMTKKNTQDLAGDIEDSFGVRLSIAMKFSGDTKSSLARKSDLSEGAIRAYLKNESSPSVAQLMKLSKALGIRASWLLGEGNEPHSKLDAEEDISLLIALFRHLSGMHRRMALKLVLSALASQYDEIGEHDLQNLTSKVINTAVKINSLTQEEKEKLSTHLGLDLQIDS